MTDTTLQPVLIPAPAVCKMLGVTIKTIDRWLNGYRDWCTEKRVPPLADFPKPIVINTRRYWRKDDIDAFLAGRLTDQAA
jgi:predicted DNA-binding transcriptional regulator AlpA